MMTLTLPRARIVQTVVCAVALWTRRSSAIHHHNSVDLGREGDDGFGSELLGPSSFDLLVPPSSITIWNPAQTTPTTPTIVSTVTPAPTASPLRVTPAPVVIVALPTDPTTTVPTRHPFNTCFFHETLSDAHAKGCLDSLVAATNETTSRELHRDEFLCSPNGSYRFGLTSDDGLCLCDANDAKLWCAADCCDEATFEESNNLMSEALNGGLAHGVVGHLAGTEWSPYLSLRDDGCVAVYQDHTPRLPGGRTTLWRASNNDHGDSSSSPSSSSPPPPRSRDDTVARLFLTNDGRVLSVDPADPSIVHWEADVESYVPYVPPTRAPTTVPSNSPLPTTSLPPTARPITLEVGVLVDHPELGARLSKGLTGRVIIAAGAGGSSSSSESTPDTARSDVGACFPRTNENGENEGWVYTLGHADGGVGAFVFDRHGDLEDHRLLDDDLRVGGGGTTPWNTLLVGEASSSSSSSPENEGRVWEIDPFHHETARPTALGAGVFGSVTCDDRDRSLLACFTTADDRTYGGLRRYRPSARTWENAVRTENFRDVLHDAGGIVDYLQLDVPSEGSFQWIDDAFLGHWHAYDRFPNAEGVAVDPNDGTLWFASRRARTLFALDSDRSLYEEYSTVTGGAFDAGPDQIALATGPDASYLYLCEDGGNRPGVFGRRVDGRHRRRNRYFALLEKIPEDLGGSSDDRATGLALCDDDKRLMVAFRETGTVLEIARDDGRPFHGIPAHVEYDRRRG